MQLETKMQNNLELKVQQHLSLIDASLQSTRRILTAAKDKNLDVAEFESQNRERIIGAMEILQREIEDQINTLELSSVSPDLLEVLKLWTVDLNNSFERTLVLDQEITGYLSGEKDKTTQEIATIYKARTSHKGYNLNNLKK
jgi:hypothetical protein